MEIKVLASGSSGNCFKVSDGESSILLECGIPFREIKKKLRFKTAELAGVLVTHEHQDHSKAVKDFAYAGADVYLSEGTANAIGIEHHLVKIVYPFEKLWVGDWLVMPFDVHHDAREPLGYLLQSANTGEKLLFFADAGYIEHRFKEVTHILGECNYSKDLSMAFSEAGLSSLSYRAKAERILDSHMGLVTLSEYLEAMDKSNLEQVHLIHLSDQNSDAKVIADTVKAITGVEVYTY